MSLSIKEVLIKTLIEKGLLSEAQLNEAMKLQAQRGGELKDILIEQKFVRREDVLSTLSNTLGIPPIK